VAYAGHAALAYLNARVQTLESLAERVGARGSDDLENRIDSILAEVETLRREVQRRQQQQAHESAGKLSSHARDIHGVRVVAEEVQNASQEDLKQLVDAVREDLRSGVVVLGSAQNGKVPIVVGVTEDLTSRLHAGDLAKEVAKKAGGGAGGRPEFGIGAGTQPAQLRAALQHAFTVVEQTLQTP
jgi:alanyl-tRNA synthetase